MFSRLLVMLMALTLMGAACADDKKDTGGASSATTTTAKADVDYKAIGLWNDGPCDKSKPELKIGLMTVFESPIVSLKDQADALKASATAFNKRGGANGSCIAVTVCDDGANPDQAVACVRKIDEAGVVATVNDQGTSAQAEVSSAMAKAEVASVSRSWATCPTVGT